jgi:hypothetical protein
MLAVLLKPILTLLPEAAPLMKAASVEQELPVDSRDSCIASSLAVTYAANVSRTSLDPDLMDKVAHAVTLYDLEETLRPLREQLVKRAKVGIANANRDLEAEYLAKQAYFEGQLSSSGVDGKVEAAQELCKAASALGVSPGEAALRYSGQLPLNKQAAVAALGGRYHVTGNTTFVKLAAALDALPGEPSSATVQDLCKTVSELDKEAKLTTRGLDFYKEALFTKSAAISALNIKLAGKDVPYEKIRAVGKSRFTDYIGADVAAELDNDPPSLKAAFEALPVDLQGLIVRLCNNV